MIPPITSMKNAFDLSGKKHWLQEETGGLDWE